MSEAEVLYSDVRFTRATRNDKEIASSSEESTYSEIKILKTQPPAEQPASQQVVSDRRSKVTSDRVSLLVLAVLLTAAVIGLGVVCFDNFQTTKTVQTLKEKNETMMKTLQSLKQENEAMRKNLTAFNETKISLQILKDENEAMRKNLTAFNETKNNLQILKDENEAMRKNLTERLSEIKDCTTLQSMCPEPTEVKNNETCQKCEEGWEQHGGKCYYFSIISSSWEQSREECRQRGGDLVKIDSREEQSFLKKRLREKMNEPEDKFWIGLTDSEEEGRWLWVDGSALNTSLSFWSWKEPDDWKGTNPDGEDCARMGEKGGADNLKCWFDKSCNDSHRSICEKPAVTGHNTCTFKTVKL